MIRFGEGAPVFVIAEAGVNHDGDLNVARELIDVAVSAGADAVKFQMFRADRLAGRDAPKARYQLETTDPGESQREMLRKLELSEESHVELKGYADQKGMEFLSTPFDEESVDALERIGVKLIKLGSGEVTNLPLLEHVARKGLPVVLSTGMATLEEVERALGCLREEGAHPIGLLHCVSNYPARAEDANLRAIQTMNRALSVPIGYSDHTPGIEVSLAAVALGAQIIEKHFTLDRNRTGPDHQSSIEPGELHELVARIRTVESALGDSIKRPAGSETENRRIVRRSLAASRDLPAGKQLEATDLIALRPGTGISPFDRDQILGRELRRDLAQGEILSREDLA